MKATIEIELPAHCGNCFFCSSYVRIRDKHCQLHPNLALIATTGRRKDCPILPVSVAPKGRVLAWTGRMAALVEGWDQRKSESKGGGGG